MHELALTREIVAIVCEAAHGRRVRKVTLEIGELSLRDARRRWNSASRRSRGARLRRARASTFIGPTARN